MQSNILSELQKKRHSLLGSPKMLMGLYLNICLSVSAFILTMCGKNEAIKHAHYAFEKNDFDSTIEYCTEALREDPKNVVAIRLRGTAYSHKDEYNKAIRDFSEALRLDPSSVTSHLYRAYVYRIQGELGKALGDINEAILLNPSSSDTYRLRGYTHMIMGDFEEAITDLMESIRLDPDNAAPYGDLAVLRAECPRSEFRSSQMALEFATKASRLATNSTLKNFQIGTMASGYAEAGDFSKAVELQEEYINTLKASDKQLKRARERMELFKAHKPYRFSTSKSTASLKEQPLSR